MTNILVINIHSSRNAGDYALVLVTLQQLRQNFPGCLITLAMDDPDLSFDKEKIVDSVFAWVKVTKRRGIGSWRLGNLFLFPFSTITPLVTYRLFGKPIFVFTPAKLQAIIQPYLDADIVISKPGGFLYSSGSGLVFVILIYTLAMAWMAGKPFYIYPQSFGPLKRKWEGCLLRWILGKARIVMARERVSFELLKNEKFHHPRFYLLPDTAFAFDGAPVSVAHMWMHEHGLDTNHKYPLLGLTAINWGAQNPNFKRQGSYEDACAQSIRYFVNHLSGRAVIFPQVTGPSDDNDDRVPARRIAERLSDIADSILLVEQQIAPNLIKTLFGQMDIFIGSRMHSNIFALSEGVPIIAISYMHKTQGIAAMLNLDQWVLDIREITPKVLTDKVAELWLERDDLKARIISYIPFIKREADRAGLLCEEDYAHFCEMKRYER